MTLTVNGLSFHVVDEGDGPAVALPGVTGERIGADGAITQICRWHSISGGVAHRGATRLYVSS